ncbi:methyltransferase domain-containing protein [Dyadobacter tibetensis]|uniref:methyltransferase domain-containing protein n=1 Tax=Dyadobacter tibetensis TaxID=1211851 RepID=UPI00047109BC|nr:methyltransferase domain-containing protein [Dyadobacter tibetensis]
MFKIRSTQQELLDAEAIPSADLFRNLKELDIINHWLGGYQVTFDALNKLLDYRSPKTMVDLGSGGGDTLNRIYDWTARKGFPINLVGIDLKSDCVEYAIQNRGDRSIRYICDDYQHLDRYLEGIDILHASLFCHHLTHSQLVALVKYALSKRCILIINDLERTPLAYYGILGLTSLFSKSYLVQNDAPLSVLRGFKSKEWKQILDLAGARRYTIRNKWAFRHQIIVYGN